MVAVAQKEASHLFTGSSACAVAILNPENHSTEICITQKCRIENKAISSPV